MLGRTARWLGVGALMAGAVVCASRQVSVGSARVAKTARVRELLTFERTGCFGDCPTYKLVLFEDGQLQFGGPDEENPDAADARIDPPTMAKIRSTLQRLSGLPSDCCNCYDMTDMPSVKMSFSPSGSASIKTIEHYHGCEKAPDWLYEVENSIDEILETERWVGRKIAYKPYHPSKP